MALIIVTPPLKTGPINRRNLSLAHPNRCVLKREYYRGMVAAGPCAELQQLKQQYESALRAWGSYEFPLHNEPVGTRPWRSEQLQLKQRALDARNAAKDRVLDHKRICSLCAAKRNSPNP
jgi:hypothetical protein